MLTTLFAFTCERPVGIHNASDAYEDATVVVEHAPVITTF